MSTVCTQFEKEHNKFTAADQSPPGVDLQEVIHGEIDMLQEIQLHREREREGHMKHSHKLTDLGVITQGRVNDQRGALTDV